MAVKKKATKKKSTSKKTTGGIAAYTRKIQRHHAVVSKTKKIKKLETQLKAAKKEKAAVVKGVRKLLKK